MTITSMAGAKEVFEHFTQMSILIIGDVMIDSYLFGAVDRISPEAPVPIVAVNKRVSRLGGAANVALNIKAMGAKPILCTVVGNDEQSHTFDRLLDENQLPADGIIQSQNRITTTKFRIIGNNVQMLRVDEEHTHALTQEDEQALKQRIKSILEDQRIDAIIFQDYDKGVISPSLIDFVVQLSATKNIPVTVDPKKRNFAAYRNLTLFKPNLKELKEGLGMSFDNKDAVNLRQAIRQIHEQHKIDRVMVTLSEAGVFISRRLGNGSFEEHHVPAHHRSIADVSGAGDTVISLATLCLAAGLPEKETAALSNLAGGQVCEFVGVVPVNRDKLLSETSKLVF